LPVTGALPTGGMALPATGALPVTGALPTADAGGQPLTRRAARERARAAENSGQASSSTFGVSTSSGELPLTGAVPVAGSADDIASPFGVAAPTGAGPATGAMPLSATGALRLPLMGALPGTGSEPRTPIVHGAVPSTGVLPEALTSQFRVPGADDQVHAWSEADWAPENLPTGSLPVSPTGSLPTMPTGSYPVTSTGSLPVTPTGSMPLVDGARRPGSRVVGDVAWVRFTVGVGLYRQGHLDRARDALLGCVSLAHPEWSVRAGVALAELRLAAGDDEGARDALRIVAGSEHSRWSPAATARLGALLAQARDWDGVRGCCAQLGRHTRSLAAAGKLREAAQLARSSMILADQVARAHPAELEDCRRVVATAAQVGQWLCACGALDEAAVWFDRTQDHAYDLRRLDPDDADGPYYLALGQRMSGMLGYLLGGDPLSAVEPLQEALEHARTARRLAPNRPEVAEEYGSLILQLAALAPDRVNADQLREAFDLLSSLEELQALNTATLRLLSNARTSTARASDLSSRSGGKA